VLGLHLGNDIIILTYDILCFYGHIYFIYILLYHLDIYSP
jgi:hypothetical protein